MTSRRINLRDTNDSIIRSWDVSDIDHANAKLAVTISVDQACELGVIHQIWATSVPPWGRRLREPREHTNAPLCYCTHGHSEHVHVPRTNGAGRAVTIVWEDADLSAA